MPDWTCPSCDAHNALAAIRCENCGTPMPKPLAPPDPAQTRRLDRSEGTCYTDGSALDAEGRCLRTGLFAIARTRTRLIQGQVDRYSTQFDKPPFACPECRELITWSGTCYGCRIFPGDRYDIERGHYVMTESRPLRRATPQEAVDAVKAIGLIMERVEAEGKLRAVGDMIPVGSLLLHAVAPGLRVGEKPKPEVIPAPPLEAP